MSSQPQSATLRVRADPGGLTPLPLTHIVTIVVLTPALTG